MSHRIVTLLLATGQVFTALVLIFTARDWHLPGNQEGYGPPQPVVFSHRLHAGELATDCLYCHFAAEKGRYAGIPAQSICMNCHRVVSATLGAVQAEDALADQLRREPRKVVSAQLQQLYDGLALRLDEKQQWVRDPQRKPRPIAWIKVCNLPDFVSFDHRAHVRVGVTCQECHGAVETMERVRQVGDLSMGWCVSCHRTSNENGIQGTPVQAATDCGTCHH